MNWLVCRWAVALAVVGFGMCGASQAATREMDFTGDRDIDSSVSGHVTEIIVQTKVRHLPIILVGDHDAAAAKARARDFMEVGHPVYILDTCKEEDILALARQLKKKYGLKAKLEVTGPACWPASRVYRKHQETESLFTWVHAVDVPDGFTSEDLNLAPTPVRASKAFARRFVQPVSIAKNAAGNWLVDFGRAAFGWVEAKTPAAVDAVAGEKLTDGKSVDVVPSSAIRSARARAAATDGSFFKRLVLKTDIYSRRRCLSVPRELGEVMPMRYLEIPADAFEPTSANVRMVALEYPFDEAESGFSSDDRALDAVYDLCKYTLRACTFGGMYIDGDRERLPYEADAYVTQLSNYAMSSDYEVSRVTCDYLMPYPTWPTEYRQITVLMNWTYWMWSGKDDLLREHYAQLKDEKLMERFRRDSDGLLETGGEMSHGAYEGAADMVDWPPPERFGFEFCKANAVVNAYYYIGLNERAEIADQLGKPEDAAVFRTRAAQVYDSFQKVFFDSKRGIYVDGQGATHASIHANALAVVAGLVPEPAIKGVGDWLAGREMECSVYFAQHFLEALFRTGHGARALALMMADNDRSWIGMIKSGATLTKESWNEGVKANMDWNHTWGTAAINVISRCLAGVTPARPGFEKIHIAPDPAGLGTFNAKVPTAKGPVTVRYARTDVGEHLVVTTPAPATIIFRGETREVAAGTHTLVTSASAIGGMPLENEDKAYGDLQGRIVERIRLWPGLAPHETESSPGRFAYDEKKLVWRRRDISQPELVILRPEGKPIDTMVVVIPGGGYQSQQMGHVCRDARPILDSGRWVAVLHYRIPRREGRKIYDAPREDAARAIRFLRANAERLGFSPEKIGAVGFSAGAHLAAISAVSSQDALYDRVDDLDDISAHLNFAVPVYPAYVADDGATGFNVHGGDGAVILPEFKFDAKTPPMFMLHGDKDQYSPMASVLLYAELHKRKIPAQLFVYANVSHGLGDTPNVKGWQSRIVDWMESIGF